MNKFDKYIKSVKNEKEFLRRQERLHEKHKGIDENKVIIEKSSTFKFTLLFLWNLFRIICNIIFFILVAIGILTLIYPQIRHELFLVIAAVWNEIQEMMGVI
ncbi:MAG: hypothetical protein KH297_04740 [Firmicutes bacterium]|nr:hypothetical protein [Bacillota bacterium]